MKTILLISSILIILGWVVVFIIDPYITLRIDTLKSEISLWKGYCKEAAEKLNRYKPEAKEYIGKKYNNTDNGEVIIITDIFYSDDTAYLRLKGKTRSGAEIQAPFDYFRWIDNSNIRREAVFNLRELRK